jgi:serine/threonine protein kinase
MEELPQLGRPIKVIGRYALYGKLAAGGMATVHFGRLMGPAGFSRTVAIKRLHPQFAKDPEFVAMFLDEARVAARIQHPNVVATVDVVAMAEELFLVMDYIRGESFSRLLRSSRRKSIEIPLGVITNITAGMLHGLHAAHEAKDEQGRPLSVVHRDVSPQNVLVGADGVPRVLDFGVAKAAARIQVTRDGQMKGKLSYMAPEQLQGRGVDRRTDVFAAAIVTWEALTGRRLFDAEEPQEVLRMIVSEDIPPPSAVVPSIPRAIDAVVMKGLARDVTVRFQTAREFAIALEEVTQIASPREVGEWVERVAGDTLLHREQAVAEIEAISAVSDVSLVTGASPGFTSTMVGHAPPPVAAAAAAASEWDDGPTRIYDSAAAVSEGDDHATRVHVPRPSTGGAQGDLHPSLANLPRIPSLIPPAARVPTRSPSSSRAPPKPPRSVPPPGQRGTAPPRAGARNSEPTPPSRTSHPPPRGAAPSTTSSLPPRDTALRSGTSHPPPRGALSPRASDAPPGSVPQSRTSHPPPRGLTPSKPSHPPRASVPPRTSRPPPLPDSFDDGDQTQIRAPLESIDENLPTQILDKSQPGWDDDGETTQVLDKAGDELLDAAARVTGPPELPRRSSRPAPRPAAGSPPQVTTIIVQDHTSPALLRERPAAWMIARAWFWGTPAARARRVGSVAGTLGLLVGVAYGYGSHGKKPTTVHTVHASSPSSLSDRPAVVATTALEREPRGIDPAMLPKAPPEVVETHHAPPSPEPEAPGPSPIGRSRVKPLHVSLDTATPAAPAAAAPALPSKGAASSTAPGPSPSDDDLESPYAHVASAPRAVTPKPQVPPPTKAPTAPASEGPAPPAVSKVVSAPKAAGGCGQPFVLDEHGIKRIKPECL